jgi:ADP-ribose pyrophosphatase YjhB (NUDIX family)
MFCIWCGSAAEGDVVISCGGCGRTHFLNSKISASTLTVAGDTYLAVKRAAPPELGKWDLPGGFCEYGEDPAAAATRETFEESSIKVVVSRLIGVFMDEYIEPDGRPWPTMNLVYLATPDDIASDLTNVDADEIAALAWHPLATPPTDIAFPTQQLSAIDAYLHQSPST